MTELSGGQTRALLIANATVICDTPIVLLDEVENAGINRLTRDGIAGGHRRSAVCVTHDPRIALLSDYRIVMRDGRIAEAYCAPTKASGGGARGSAVSTTRLAASASACGRGAAHSAKISIWEMRHEAGHLRGTGQLPGKSVGPAALIPRLTRSRLVGRLI